MRILEVKNLKRKYKGSKEYVLRELDLSVKKGEFVGIMGRSGCGKTTLLKVLGLIDKADDGEVFFNGEKVDGMSYDDLARMRRNKIGFIFQDYYLMDSISIEENIILPHLLDNRKMRDGRAEMEKYVELLGISKLLEKMPNELSGGEKQRVAICRALINRPDVILADEPTGNLDSKAGKIVIDLMQFINKTLDKTIVMVTHDPMLASYCSRIVFLKDGKVLEELEGNGDTQVLYEKILKKMIIL